MVVMRISLHWRCWRYVALSVAYANALPDAAKASFRSFMKPDVAKFVRLAPFDRSGLGIVKFPAIFDAVDGSGNSLRGRRAASLLVGKAT
jgi:hypothetical protein